jgi:hypothetical protein
MLGMLSDVHPAMVFLEKSTIESSEFKVAYLEIITPSLDNDIYNFRYFYSVGNSLTIAAFNCFDKEKDDWRPVIRQIIESMRPV